jgi:hypothetical protein
MKTANAKGLAVKGMLGAVAMGAIFFAGAAKAQAQGFAVGVQFGEPAYYGQTYPQAAYYGAPGYYDGDGRRDAFIRHEQHEAMERREAYIRHEQWEHSRDFDRDGRRFDRDDRRFDRDDRRWR